MEPRISLITLGVKNLEKSLQFYRDGLGFPTTWSVDKGVIFFKTGGTVLALYPLNDLEKDVWPDGVRTSAADVTTENNPAQDSSFLVPHSLSTRGGVRGKSRVAALRTRDASPSARVFSGIALAHNVRTQEEVDKLLDQAQAAGGRIEKPGQKAFWGGYSGYFSDPDGYIWEVAYGAFPLREDGSLEIP